MSAATDRLHLDWLRLIDISGPFLTLPVLGEVFPQGLDGLDPAMTRRLRTAYEEWTANTERRQPDRALHRSWVQFVLEEVLEWPREAIAEGQGLPQALTVDVAEHVTRLRPDLALMDASREGDLRPRVLVDIWPPEQELDKAAPDKRWAASPATRMAELLRGTGVRLGLVTNGRQWMLVDAPRGETAAFVTWEVNLWLDEPVTLRAFVSLLGTGRILGETEERTLEALLAKSKQGQADVTTQLGNQVRHAVELLVRAIDRADQQSGGDLLAGASDDDLYEAAITVMMRLVFLLFAEDQRPPLIGGPGTGKSTVALYRVRSLIEALRADGIKQPRVLFTTYTTALVASSRQLLRRLLGPDAACVDVRTADSLVMDIITGVQGKANPIDAAGLRSAFKEALATAVFDGNALQRRAQAQTIERLGPDYLLEEIGNMIEARALSTLDEYLVASRAGRRVPLNATQRTAIWRVHEALNRVLVRRNQSTWEQLRRRAAQLVRDGKWTARYDGVVVDEVQDLNPTVLRLLVDVCGSPDRLFVTADANQSIYGAGFRWTDIHEELDFRGRTGILRRNYRSTLQVDRAARDYLAAAALDVPEAEIESSYVRQDGPRPVVRAVATAHDQTQLLYRFAREATRAFRLGIGSCAVLVPTEEMGKSIAGWLKGEGLAAEYMPGRELDLEKPVVKVITLKSAKGLEFPIVALAGFNPRSFPGVPTDATDEELHEALTRERRTMYVGMTRAMLALLVALPAAPQFPAAPLYSGFDPTWWDSRDATGAAA